ncbi:MAG: OB-fold domain-containing protein [Acidimicrobiia bacterium]|nr:OB-fold domain-containing protein [Acidimicrobiia bacterium]
MRTRWPDGSAFDYEDARLERDRGLRTAMSHAALGSDLRAVAGVDGRTAASLGADGDLAMPTSGASSPVFALASLVERRASGTLAAVEQATLVAGMLTRPGEATVLRHEAPGRPRPARSAGRPMAARVSLPAYDRAFESKLYLKAARCPTCAELSYPPRSMCLSCGGPVEGPDVTLARTGVIYSVVTVRVPVPGLATPYSLAVVELDGTGVRTLVPVTGVEPGTARIGDRGTLVFRRILVRSGVPDYGYAFWPEVTA